MMWSGIRAAWREVKPVVLILGGISVLAWPRWRWLSMGTGVLLGGIFYFFRDPNRHPPTNAPEWILAPADGVVTHIDRIDEPHYFKGTARRVSIFLSLFDVHVQRAPYQGTVQFLRYESGRFAPAFLKETHTNESNFMGLATPYGPVGVKQIVGILARRIVCRPAIGDSLATGERFGLIKFGSRVDLLLPDNAEILVHPRQKVYGGQTIVARWNL